MRLSLICSSIVLAAFATDVARADLVLETETARLGTKGTWSIGNALQMEKDGDGSTYLTLTALEYAVTDRLELLVEPFFYEWQVPKDGDSISGIGDTEVTVSYLAVPEGEYTPAIVFAGKVKLPTGQSPDIGTGKADYTGYVILGKKIGNVDFNANIAYETFGQTPDFQQDDQLIFDLSAEYSLNERWTAFAEVFGDRSGSSLADGSTSFAVAAEYQINDHLNTFVSVGDDTDNLKTVRVGFTVTNSPPNAALMRQR